MKDQIDATVALALEAGAISADSLPIHGDAPAVPKPAESAEPWRPWEPKPRDPWADKGILRLASDPRGIVVATALHNEGNLSDAELEVVRELWGTPKDHFYKIEDPAAALDVASFYRERGVVDDDEFKGLCEGLAHRETERERQEAARLEEQARQEQERIDRERQAENHRAEIQQRATDLFYDKLDKLNGVQAETKGR